MKKAKLLIKILSIGSLLTSVGVFTVSCDSNLDFDDTSKIKPESPKEPSNPVEPSNPKEPEVPKIPDKPTPPVNPEQPKPDQNEEPNKPPVNSNNELQPIKFNPNNPKEKDQINFDPITGFPMPGVRSTPMNFSNLKPGFYDFFKENQTISKPSRDEIYKEIYDRTFALKVMTKIKRDDSDGTILSDKDTPGVQSQFVLARTRATSWLFDYAKSDKSNKYSLFFATNLHVATDIANSWTNENKNTSELFDYSDPSLGQVEGISLGKSTSPYFNKINNKTSFPSNNAMFYTNLKHNIESNQNVYGTVQKGISKPKLIFTAIDFMDDNASNQFSELLKERLDGMMNYGNETMEKFWTREWLAKGKKPSYFKDIAIFQVDVNLDEVDSEFKGWINNAVSALDKSILRTKNKIIPNHDSGNIPYATYDFSSLQKAREFEGKFRNYKNFEYANTRVDNVYIGSYPDKDKLQKWAINNPIERDSFDYKSLNTYSVSTAMEIGNTSREFFFHRSMFEYGLSYKNIHWSSMFSGASGSIAYSDYGLPIGIYTGSTNNPSYSDLSSNGNLEPFSQITDYKIDINNGKSAILYAYNLIDGSNKEMYPHQKTSYRQNLNYFYNSGIGEDKITKTALFPNGFKL
ncbi:MIP family Ig-specific serine endopeptidase [Mycoplasma crocodyli]|uniref:Hypothetical membrane lipoprotein n=1 Tax=Mycoplasma crocodyli (strain ATCC 51981 / MP145) TaxID=512564 RepID=D5E5J3_MYCCM|nr:hypothetical protein [Mycoplasma crocodyli]ADE19449.1 hypothetical membrane lipoprotein [Mycoplasma crocodyli MP145]